MAIRFFGNVRISITHYDKGGIGEAWYKANISVRGIRARYPRLDFSVPLRFHASDSPEGYDEAARVALSLSCGYLQTMAKWHTVVRHFGQVRVIDDDFQVCQDCLMIIANDDDSGMDEARAEEVRNALAKIEGSVCAGDSEKDRGFSHNGCDCCSSLPTDLYHCVIMSR